MTGYNGQDFSKEFTERTLKVFENTSHIYNEYEATTLVNLALGLIVIPAEYVKYTPRLNNPNRSYAETLYTKHKLNDMLGKKIYFAEESFCEEIYGDGLNDLDYFEFLRLVRNGLSHGLVGFIGNPIQKIKISNRKRNGRENFEIIISTEDFKFIMKKISQIHLKLVESQKASEVM